MEMQVANLAAFVGAAIAIGFGAIGSGWGIGYTGVGTARAMARQPNQNSSLFRGMLIGQAVASNPSIFALVVAVILYQMGAASDLADAGSWAKAAALLGAGISIGLGAIGSGAGNGLIGSDAMEAISRCPSTSGKVTVMMVIAQAMGQTPVLFSLVVSLILIVSDGDFATYATTADQVKHAGRLLGMGICMGAGALGPGLGSSFIGGKFCEGLARAPQSAMDLNKAYFIGVGISQSASVFAFVVALLLMSGE